MLTRLVDIIYQNNIILICTAHSPSSILIRDAFKLFCASHISALPLQMDPLEQIKMSTLQISGIFARVQAKKYNFEEANMLCHTLTDRIDLAASELSSCNSDKAVSQKKLSKVTLDYQTMRKANAVLAKDKWKLKTELELARKEIASLKEKLGEDLDLVSFCDSYDPLQDTTTASEDSMLTSTPLKDVQNE